MRASGALQIRNRRPGILAFEFLAIFLAFVAAGSIGILLNFPGTIGSPFWPPSGIGLIAYLLRGRSALPAIGAGAAALDLAAFDTLPATTLALDAAGAVVEPFLAVWVMSRLSTDPPLSFATTRGVLAGWTGMMAGTSAATVLGLLGFYASGQLPLSNLAFSALNWWIGNTTGMMVIAPVLSVWLSRPSPQHIWKRPFEAAALLVLLPAVAGIAYAADVIRIGVPIGLFEVIGVPVVLAATYRFMIHGTVTAIAATSSVAVVIGIMAMGGQELRQPEAALLRLQMFVAVVGITGHLLISQIATRGRAEKELRQALAEAKEANMAKTMFLAKMSHELRTPLNAIMGFSEVITLSCLGDTPQAHDRYRSYAHDIHVSGRHLMLLINDILDVARIEANTVELAEQSLSVPHEVDECLAILRQRAQSGAVTLEIDHCPHLPLLRADSRAFRQIIINVVDNAIKFSAPGGTVRINCRSGAEGVVVVVTDTGAGMSQDEHGHLFEPFRRGDPHISGSRREGTGLGLAICKGLLDLHQGSITVRSGPDAGTTVTIAFPPARCEPFRP